MEPNEQTTGDSAASLPTADELQEHLLPTTADHEAFEAHLRANAMQVGIVGDSSSQPQPHHHVVEEHLRPMQFGGDSSSSQLQPHHRAGGLSQPTAADVEALEAYLRAMQVGNPSLLQLQPHHRAVASPTLLNPHQLLARTAAPFMLPHGHLLPPQALNYGRIELSPGGHIFRRPAYDVSWWLQSPPQASSYGYVGVEPSPADHTRRLAYESWRSQLQPQASSYGDLELHPVMNAPAARTPSMAPRRSNLRANAEDWRPNSPSHRSGVQPSLIHNTSQNGSADADARDPQTFTLLRMPHPAAQQLTRQDVRDLLLREPKDQDLLMSAQSSAHVVELLKERRNERVRKTVLFMARGVVHRIIESREGNDVFVALLQACAGKFDELGVIVSAVCNGKGFLMLTVEDDLGEKALKDLIEAVASARDLRLRLAHGLFSEGLMERRKGPVLLRHCFANLSEEDREIIIQLRVLNDIGKILSSPFGWECLEVCLAYATNDKVMALEENIVSRTSVIAKDPSSYRFLLNALLNGSEQLKVRIAERVGANILELSVHKFGHYVVEACILQPEPPQVLQLVLSAILGLHDNALQELVRGLHSSNVVVQLLTAGKETFPENARTLAMRIAEALPAAVRGEEHADLVMRAICKLF